MHPVIRTIGGRFAVYTAGNDGCAARVVYGLLRTTWYTRSGVARPRSARADRAAGGEKNIKRVRPDGRVRPRVLALPFAGAHAHHTRPRPTDAIFSPRPSVANRWPKRLFGRPVPRGGRVRRDGIARAEKIQLPSRRQRSRDPANVLSDRACTVISVRDVCKPAALRGIISVLSLRPALSLVTSTARRLSPVACPTPSVGAGVALSRRRRPRPYGPFAVYAIPTDQSDRLCRRVGPLPRIGGCRFLFVTRPSGHYRCRRRHITLAETRTLWSSRYSFRLFRVLPSRSSHVRYCVVILLLLLLLLLLCSSVFFVAYSFGACDRDSRGFYDDDDV